MESQRLECPRVSRLPLSLPHRDEWPSYSAATTIDEERHPSKIGHWTMYSLHRSTQIGWVRGSVFELLTQ
jgi:hypothetical protein